MHDTVADFSWDPVRLRRRAAAGQRVVDLFREAAGALVAGNRLAAEALLAQARDVTEELEATADSRRWLRWISSDARRLAAVERELDTQASGG
jgi:hypothetical protein